MNHRKRLKHHSLTVYTRDEASSNANSVVQFNSSIVSIVTVLCRWELLLLFSSLYNIFLFSFIYKHAITPGDLVTTGMICGTTVGVSESKMGKKGECTVSKILNGIGLIE